MIQDTDCHAGNADLAYWARRRGWLARWWVMTEGLGGRGFKVAGPFWRRETAERMAIALAEAAERGHAVARLAKVKRRS